MANFNRKQVASRLTFGVGPFMGDISHSGTSRDDLVETWYWKHLRRFVLRRLVKGVNALAPSHPDFCTDPQKAARDTYQRLIFALLCVLQDELGALIVIVKDEDYK